jgi:type IV secretion system protein TrbL
MAIPDANILTSLLKDFTSITANSRPLIEGYAIKVLITLTTIDILVVSLFCLMDNQDIVKTMLRRTLKYAGFAFLVIFYKDIVNAFSESFLKIGLEAGGKVLTANDFTNPSYISTLGMDMIGPFVQSITNGKSATDATLDSIMSLPSSILLGLVYLMILGCFFAIAINIFILYIEFAVFTSIALILVPFGVWEHTSFIFDKAKNGVINYGIKYMTLAFIVSIAMSKIKDWQLPPDPTFQQALYVLLGMLAITYLSWHAPTVAAGFAGGGGGSMSGAAIGGFAGSMAGKAASTAGGTGKALVGGINQNTGTRSGILPTVGRMTGATAGLQNAASKIADMGKEFGNNLSQKYGNSGNSGNSPPPTPPPAASGVNLNTGSSGTDTGSSNTDTSSSNSPKGPPPVKPSGVNVQTPDTNTTAV